MSGKTVLSYIIVGSGHRAEFYGRIARTYPDLFRAIFLCRSEEKVAKMRMRTGIDATTSLETCESLGADFVVVAVNKTGIASVCEEWIRRGYPVVCETPVGATQEDLLRLWYLKEKEGAKITVCEQYHRYPLLAAGLDRIAEGRIGTPQSAYISLTQDYHAASLLQRALQTQGEGYRMRGENFRNSVVETDSRAEAITDGHSKERVRSVVHVTFSSGKMAVYDYSGLQSRSFIRSRHLVVRGDRGEWNDNMLCYVDERNLPVREFLMQEIKERYRVLDTQWLRDLRKTWQSELFLDTRQDEFAMATMLYDMKDYLAGGEEVYPLAEALDDAYFWLMMQKATANPWEEVVAEDVPWRHPAQF